MNGTHPVYHIPDVDVVYDLLLCHARRDELLLRPGPRGWLLPRFAPQEHHFGVVGHIQQALQEQLGASAAVMGCLSSDFDREAGRLHRVYALDLIDFGWEPPAPWTWQPRDELPALRLAEPRARAAVRSWAAELDTHPARLPWARPGWLPRAATWMTNRLTAAGYLLTGPIIQERAWALSSLLRVTTERGPVLLKGSAPQFAAEPALTALLAAAAPSLFPTVIATHPQQGWLLLAATPGPPLSQTTDERVWTGVVAAYGAQQQALAARRDALLATGCPHRPVADLPAAFRRLLRDRAALQPNPDRALDDAAIARLTIMADRLPALVAQLEAIPLPETLVHGDFHAGNVLQGPDGPVVIDFSTAALSHPFFDIHFLLSDDALLPTPLHPARPRLADAYLAQWADHGPDAALRRAFELAAPLSAVYHALRFYDVVRALEPAARWEMANMVPWLLARVLLYFDAM